MQASAPQWCKRLHPRLLFLFCSMTNSRGLRLSFDEPPINLRLYMARRKRDQHSQSESHSASECDPRQMLNQAILTATVNLHVEKHGPPARPSSPIEVAPSGSQEELRASFAVLLGKDPKDISDEELCKWNNQIEAAAAARAQHFLTYRECQIDHLLAIGCPPEEVENYLRFTQRTLASLYFLVAQTHPSPAAVHKLALRYACDARKPIEGDINRFSWKRVPEGWLITEYPSLSHRMMPIPLPGRLIKDSFVVAVLDHVFTEMPRSKLMQLIEVILDGPPKQSDTLEAADRPSFTYDIVGGESNLVRLWINGVEVRLSKSRDVHRLLVVLCKCPRGRFQGRQLGREAGITNVAQAATKIRKSLESTFSGAGGWLLTSPVCWAAEYGPAAVSTSRQDA